MMVRWLVERIDIFVGGAAVFVSAVALLVAWAQSSAIQRHQHAQVWPFPVVDFEVDQDPDATRMILSLTNSGVGTAIVREVSVEVNGEAPEDWGHFLVQFLPQSLAHSAEVEAINPGMGALRAGESVTILSLIWPRTADLDTEVLGYIQGLITGDSQRPGVNTCYCSVYERCWRGTLEHDSYGARHPRTRRCGPSVSYIERLMNGVEGAPQTQLQYSDEDDEEEKQ